MERHLRRSAAGFFAQATDQPRSLLKAKARVSYPLKHLLHGVGRFQVSECISHRLPASHRHCYERVRTRGAQPKRLGSPHRSIFFAMCHEVLTLLQLPVRGTAPEMLPSQPQNMDASYAHALLPSDAIRYGEETLSSAVYSARNRDGKAIMTI